MSLSLDGRIISTRGLVKVRRAGASKHGSYPPERPSSGGF